MRFQTAALGLFFVACYSSGEGISPPLDRIYFPVGLAIDKEQKRLYVASSDFDLQFNAGSVQVLDIERIRKMIPRECDVDADCDADSQVCDNDERGGSYLCAPKAGKFRGKPCGSLGEQTLAERVTVPGRCKHVDLNAPPTDLLATRDDSTLVVDSVGIGAFATDVVLKYYGDDKSVGRLLIPTRGDSGLYWIDLNAANGHMDCAQSKEKQRCSFSHRVGTDADENSRNEKMPTEPFGIAVNDEGDAIVVTHQTTGKVSLFYQDRTKLNQGPKLSYVQPNLPTQVLAVAAIPSSKSVADARSQWLSQKKDAYGDPFPPGFLVAYRSAAQVDLLRFYSDDFSSPARPFLQLASTVPITANSVSRDSRGIAFDDAERKACEATCAEPADVASCLSDCSAKPIDVYVTSRAPASLLVGETMRDTWLTPNRDLPHFHTVVPLPTGPSRVYVGKIVSETGQLETRVFVVCFESSTIAIYNPRTKTVEDFIATGRGPHAMAFDVAPGTDPQTKDARSVAYVGHFTDSYIGVVELDRRKRRTYSKIVLSLGPAIAPRASK